MATRPAAMSAIIMGTVNGLMRLGPRCISAVWLIRIHLSGIHPRLRERLLGSGQRELAVPADVTGGLAVHVVLGVEALDLGRDLGVEAARVEPGDRADARRALDHVRPHGLLVVADGGDEAYAGDSHTPAVRMIRIHAQPSLRTSRPEDIGTL